MLAEDPEGAIGGVGVETVGEELFADLNILSILKIFPYSLILRHKRQGRKHKGREGTAEP